LKTNRDSLQQTQYGPDWAKSMSWEDFARIEGVRFFEVYNGHNGKLDHGDGERLGTEEM